MCKNPCTSFSVKSGVLLIVLVAMLSACSSKFNLQKKRYSRGYYFSGVKRHPAPLAQKQTKINGQLPEPIALKTPSHERVVESVVENEQLTVSAAKTAVKGPQLFKVIRQLNPKTVYHRAKSISGFHKTKDFSKAQKSSLGEQQKGPLGTLIKLIILLIVLFVVIFLVYLFLALLFL